MSRGAGRARSAAAGLALLLAIPATAAIASRSAAAGADSTRSAYRLLLVPVHTTPVHESRWGRDAGAALRRELAAIPWIELVDPRPSDPGGPPRELPDWPSAIGEARRLGCTAFLRTELKACTCDQNDDTRNPWQGWITIDLKLDYVGDSPAVEASDEDYVTGPWPEALEVRVPEMVNGLIVGLVPQILEGLALAGHVTTRLDARHVVLDRGVADGLHTGARLVLVHPGHEAGQRDPRPIKAGDLEVTSVAESTAVAVFRSATAPAPGQPWRWLPPRPVTGGSTIRGLMQTLGTDERCCP